MADEKPSPLTKSRTWRPKDEWLGHLVRDVMRDAKSREPWLQRQAGFLYQRYCIERRDRKFPWPGASTICMPTTDTAVKRLSSAYIQSLLATDPPVTVLALKGADQAKAIAVERRLKHLLDVRMPDAEKEAALATDLLLQTGHVCILVGYDYRTRMAREVVTRDRLPDPIKAIVANAPVDEDQADAIFQLTGRPVVSQKELADGESMLRLALRAYYGLDPKDRLDKKAEDALVKWLLDGKEDSVTIKRREVSRSTPRYWAQLPEDLILNYGATSVDEARRITVREWVTREQFEQRWRDEQWDDEAAEEALKRGVNQRASRVIDYLATARREINSAVPTVYGTPSTADSDDAIELWTTYCWADIDGDGEVERAMLTIHPGSRGLLKGRELPYDLYEWPIIQIRREHADRGVYTSRGIPEILRPLDEEITTQHRAKLNAMSIANAPTFKGRIGSGLNARVVQWRPGQIIWLQRMDDFDQVRVDSKDVSYIQEEQQLVGWVERLAAIYDSSLTEQRQLTRPRTAGEINAITGLQEQAIGSDLLLWHRGWARVFRWLHALDVQFGPDEVWVRTTEDERPVRQTRHEIQGAFEFQPSPAALMSPVLRLQKAQAMLQVLTQAAQTKISLASEDEEIRPLEAIRAIMESIDPRLMSRIIHKLTPAEKAKKQQEAQAAQGQGAIGLPPGLFAGPIDQSAARAQAAVDVQNQSGVPIASPPLETGGLI